MHLGKDLKEFIGLLRSERVRFLVVGAAALAVHGRPRYTGDVDFWIECTPANAKRMQKVFDRFGFTGTEPADFKQPDQIIQLGRPPNRIDILTGLTGVAFASCWKKRVVKAVEGIRLPFLDLESLRTNKKATGRPQDLADVQMMKKIRPGKRGRCSGST